MSEYLTLGQHSGTVGCVVALQQKRPLVQITAVIALNKSTVLLNFINFYFINLLCNILWKLLLFVYLHRVYSRPYLNGIYNHPL